MCRDKYAHKYVRTIVKYSSVIPVDKEMKIENVTNTSAYTAVIVAWRAVFREYIYKYIYVNFTYSRGVLYRQNTNYSINKCMFIVTKVYYLGHDHARQYL